MIHSYLLCSDGRTKHTIGCPVRGKLTLITVRRYTIDGPHPCACGTPSTGCLAHARSGTMKPVAMVNGVFVQGSMEGSHQPHRPRPFGRKHCGLSVGELRLI